ncbi:hypothetical protein BofuT4_uP012910.1 [Botrytis cinerea T4]|uniref:Uncharacterized protein n=1 Tax=Botryotinia fuckeliana (strain T4) TaxID=999810 RepID=G2XR14_BOTF4|nr:hypothetical protein BofuT4_uP012910.1 [Botrytis cinerea T4]
MQFLFYVVPARNFYPVMAILATGPRALRQVLSRHLTFWESDIAAGQGSQG